MIHKNNVTGRVDGVDLGNPGARIIHCLKWYFLLGTYDSNPLQPLFRIDPSNTRIKTL